MVMGLGASAWLMEVSPMRKHGEGIVASPEVLRPVSYVDDVQGVFDALWLEGAREMLESYVVFEQLGSL
eukprot:10891854-Karenia_brevis.AAC.1